MDRKEAIEIVRKNWPDGRHQLSEALETLIPELKESEDERIRKAIIATIHLYYGEPLEDEAKEMISWLEKQGECKVDCPQNYQDSSHPNGCIVLEDFNGGEGFYKLNLDCLNGKQVEEVEEMVRMWDKESKTPNENIKDCIVMCLTDADEQRFKDYNTNLKECLAWLEKQGSQNLANSAKTCKDEQKFKVGDWVVNKHGEPRIFKVISRSWPDAFLQEYKTGQTSPVNVMTLDKQCRLWDITKDAKDGDVLVYEGEIFMIKSYALWNKIVYHCCYDGKFLHKHSIYDSWGREDFDKVQPATEEQRDLLFQKIKEAGYEWDAEKKELKKVEQKPAWSEEDEIRFESTLHRMEIVGNGCAFGQLKDDIEWLKSFKERCTWKPSDEQMTALSIIKDSGNSHEHEVLDSLYYDLKKLKE